MRKKLSLDESMRGKILLVVDQWLDKPIEFADWELGPLRFFEGRWADLQFKTQATNFLRRRHETEFKAR